MIDDQIIAEALERGRNPDKKEPPSLQTIIRRKVALAIAIGVVLAGLSVLGVILAQVQLGQADRIAYTTSTAEHAPVAIVLGASVLTSGEPSDALRDRLDTALDLYRSGVVDRILITGDDGRFRVDEITVMRDYLTKAEIPWERIMVDGKGYRTYESCKRAVSVLGIRKAVLVTQRFHMGRALYLCNSFGMDAGGLVADRHEYVKGTFFWLRDLAASLKAWWDVIVMPPKPPVAD